MITKKLALLCAGLLISSFAFAQSVEENAVSETEVVEESKKQDVMVLTVDEAVIYAADHSLTLKSSALDLELAKWKSNTAWNTFLPSVQVTGSLARSNDIKSQLDQANKMALAFGQPLTKETESLHWAAVGNLSVSFNFNAAMIMNMKATMESFEAGKITYEQAVRSNELSVRKLFYALLLQQESLKLQKDSLENARQRMNQAQINYRNGYVPQIQYLQAQVAYENQVPNIEKSELQMQQSLDSFSFIIGLPVGTKVELKGEINPDYIEVDVDDLIVKAKANNLQLRSLKQSLNTLKLQATALDLSTYTPSVALSWGGQPMLKDAFNSDWGKSDNWSDNGNFSVAIVWNLTNMLPWSSSRTSAKELRTNVEKLELNLQTLERNTELDVRKAVDTLNQCKRSLETSERNITLAQKSYDMTWQSYRNGTSELLNLVEAQTQLNQAKLGLVSEKYNYMTSLMDLENILNTSLTGDR